MLDDGFRILREYQNKAQPKKGNGPGDAFVKWALNNRCNAKFVDQVAVLEHVERGFESFPDDIGVSLPGRHSAVSREQVWSTPIPCRWSAGAQPSHLESVAWAMDPTGVYWVPAFEVLQSRGLDVILANAREARAVPGRKSDVSDAQWLLRLHACGLLRDIPPTYEAFETWAADFERDQFRFTDTNRKIGSATRDLFASWYPRLLAPAVHYSIYALLDDAMITSFGFPKPLPFSRAIAAAGLRLLGHVVRWLPARKTPNFVTGRKNRTYPHGYQIARSGPPRLVEAETRMRKQSALPDN